MPPKDSESLLDNVYFGVSTGDGGYEYNPVGKAEHVDITDTSSMLPRLGEDMYGHFCKVKPIEASPQLSVEDSKKIIKEVYTKPHYKRGQRKREKMGKNDKTFLKT